MKNINLAWFLALTLWPALITNGWWAMTCNLNVNGAFIPVAIITFLLSLGYVIILFIKFIAELDD
jgi:hypothetical protein